MTDNDYPASANSNQVLRKTAGKVQRHNRQDQHNNQNPEGYKQIMTTANHK